MKKILCLLLAIAVAAITLAQTQQGVVKTRGRVVNGQVVPGTRLSGATITLNIGNPLVSAADGAFSFNVPSGKNYSLVTAKKQGYTLADPEYTRRSVAYSADNPFYVVLEDETQRQADINAATRKVRRTLMAQLQAREDEIEALKEQNKLTEEEYQNRLKALYDNQSKSEQLVKDMAERYASTDYDQLDDFNRQVQMYIEEGELQKADSMIRSKGSLEARLARIQQYDQANAQREEEIRREQSDLEKSKELAAKEKEDLANDLYNKSIIAQQQYDWDEALRCMKLRADLDTTILTNIREYACLALNQNKLYDAENTCIQLLSIYRSISDTLNIASTLYDLGKIHHILDNDSLCEVYYKESIDNYKSVCNNSFDTLSLVSVYLALANKMSARKIGAVEGRKAALSYCEETELLMNSLNYDNLGALQINYIDFLSQLGNIYRNVLNYTYLEELWMKGEHWNPIFFQNRDLYIQKISNLVSKMRTLISESDNLKLEYNLSNYASAFSQLHLLCKSIKNNVCVHEYLSESKRIYEQLYEKNPDAYRRQLAYQYYYLRSSEDTIESRYYTDKALTLFEELNKRFPGSFTEELYWLYAEEYDYSSNQKDYFQALGFARKLVDVGTAYGILPSALYNVALWYMKSNQNDVALKYVEEAIIVSISEYEKESSYNVSKELLDQINERRKADCVFYMTKGEILLMQGKNEEALAMWKKILELNPDFLKDYPDGTNLSNGLKKLGLIE